MAALPNISAETILHSLRVLGKKLFNLNSIKRHLIQVGQAVVRTKFTWGSQLPGSEAL